MKVTRLGPPRPLLSLVGVLAGGSSGPSGQVPTANGSNGVAWGSNVAIITSNGSNALLGPFVNFASGSNITFTLDQGPIGSAVPSNTLRIHGQAGGGSGSLTVKDEGTPLATAADTLDFVGAGVVASGTGSTKTITISGSGGSGLTIPDVIQLAQNGNAATSITITAAASGHSLIMFTNSTTGQVTSPACTNVTWTQIKTHTGSTAFYAIWVGIVAGGSSGTSITMTKPGSFNTVTVAEVADALTPSLGASTSQTTAGNAITVLNYFRLSGATAGRLVVMAVGLDNTGLALRSFNATPSAGSYDSTANTLALAYVVGSAVAIQSGVGGGAQIIAEVT